MTHRVPDNINYFLTEAEIIKEFENTITEERLKFDMMKTLDEGMRNLNKYFEEKAESHNKLDRSLQVQILNDLRSGFPRVKSSQVEYEAQIKLRFCEMQKRHASLRESCEKFIVLVAVCI